MRYLLKTSSTVRPSAGFTLVEILVISPIVILAIGGFIALMVGMVGNVLATRDQTAMIYQSQDSLNRIEDDIRLAADFVTTTGALISPQGSNNNFTGTSAFTNASNTLILSTLATTKNPADATRELVYYKNQPNACDAQKVFNQVYFNKVIYFIKGGSLWRRTIMPNYNTNATVDAETVCTAPWQQNSCSPGYAPATRCQTNDIELMKNVTSLTVEYYSTPNSTSNLGAGNAGAATSIKATINGKKTVSGKSITTSQSTRATRLNISVQPPTILPLQFTQHPADQSVPYIATNVQFTAKASLAGATIQWQRSTDSGSTWSNISGATGETYTLATVSQTMDGYEYRAIATNAGETATSDPGTLTVRVWTPMSLEGGWSTYDADQSTYATGMYTKTTAGLVMLKGLIAGGDTTFDTKVATLPAGYCPTSRLTFYVGSYNSSASGGSGFGRVDVLSNCEVHFMTGNNSWVSLDSIQFLASTTACTASVSPSPINGWSNYGGSYAPLTLCKDATGRINVQGLLRPGTITAGTPIGAIPAGYQPSDSRIMPAVDSPGVFNSVGIYGTSTYAVVTRGTTSNYLSVNVPYIANNGAVTWATPTILNGMTNYGSVFTTLQYGKTSDGVVMVKGLLKGGTVTNGTKVFTLPAGFHPSSRLLLPSSANNHHARIDVDVNGNVYIMGGGDTAFTSFDAVSFYADGS